MTAAADFLRAIRESPDDDAPRLVYADFLQEGGQEERAVFVRLQCKLARTKHNHRHRDFGGEPCPACNLALLSRKLLNEHGHRWIPLDPVAYTDEEYDPDSDLNGVGRLHFFRRGFVETAVYTAADWLAHADVLLAAHPVVRVRLTTRLEWDVCSTYFAIRAGDQMRKVGRHTVGGDEGILKALRESWPAVREWHLPEP